MTILQLSIFLENRFGRLNEILRIIARENIRIVASTVSDTVEYGILRLIVTEPERVAKLLRDNNISVKTSEVFAIGTDTKAGAVAAVIEPFTEAGVNIEYMYSFCSKDNAIIVLRVNDTEAAQEVIRRHGMSYLSKAELLNF